MKKIFLLLTAFSIWNFGFSQYITLTPDSADLDGVPETILEIHIDLHNSGDDASMSWMRLVNDIPDYWTTSVCDFNLCWASNADEPGYPFVAGSDTTGSVYVKFDARNYHDGSFDPVPGCGTVEITFYSPADSANYNALGVFHARLGVTEEECSLVAVSPVWDNSFSVYPNPAADLLNIVASFSAHVQEVEIVNIVGKVVQQEKWNTPSGKMSLNIHDLPQGIYFVRLIDQNGKAMYTEKLSVTQ